ncbi:response regulator [Cerasicoccus arenae]|uniref:DNA-binding response regulator n=1 Tax=Cerasicoccus arenae TaxID=424488 RepID=A0A8J3DH34_9BACT|nr:response regulator transcription factor [Cerasicoccus arenae]MBK1858571.1 response regulator transcription factor [Cerasicoccus arenae]GHC06366.1 DNA-binding response regulator [Cerasicoccus arenae]
MMTSVTPTTIIIVEDHEVVRIGLRQLIEDNEDFEILGEAGNCRDALQLYDQVKPDLVLLDLMLPDGNGVELCSRMRASDHQARILVLTSCEDDRCIFEAFAQGIDGYILKNINGAAIISALQDVAIGKSILDPSVTQHVVNHMRDSHQSKQEDLVHSLSAQERRVLEQVAKGLTNKEVAVALNLSEKTVKNYFSNVLSKLYASRRTEAAALYWSFVRRQDGYPFGR